MLFKNKRHAAKTSIGLFLLGFFGWVIALAAAPFEAQEVGTMKPQNVPHPHLPKIPSVAVEEQKALPVKPALPSPIPPIPVSDIYPIHTNILATIFWVGEPASADNGWIANDRSAWDTSWVEHFGGVDDPGERNGYHPATFTPKENPFYIALPYGEFSGGLKENAKQVYWFEEYRPGASLLKNRWVKIAGNGRTVYGQWQDVGPFESDDVSYVFGTDRPKASIGIDVSPAIRDYLGFKGKATVSWQFIDEKNVPPGPWKEIVTTSGISW